MLGYFVIGICIFLLIAVIYVSAKPISMGIEARRNNKENVSDNNFETEDNFLDKEQDVNQYKTNLSDEIAKLNELKNQGILSHEEYEKAKNKLLD
mgnify:FL=1|tara:strand:+ start:689 stop:973 length:285 start_codon:yes stop_codon:yes gene_type:complete